MSLLCAQLALPTGVVLAATPAVKPVINAGPATATPPPPQNATPDPYGTRPHTPIKPTRGRTRSFATPIFEKLTDPQSDDLSADAIQLAHLLGLHESMHRLAELESKKQALGPGGRLSHDEREEASDIKIEVLAKVEETRLQIDFVVAEIDEEQVILEEAMRIFAEDRDNRVNRANVMAFRTNGVLWAVAEALTIPTYRNPQLSIPSGAVGIVAGIVPSIFSAVATRASSGGKYERKCYPNILTKLFDLPTIPRIEYPEVVWQYFNSKPSGDTRTRKEIMQEHWRTDNNIHIFQDGINNKKIMLLTGNESYVADMTLISDKLLMMGQVRAVALQMSRPLLEICMLLRGKKHFVDGADPIQK